MMPLMMETDSPIKINENMSSSLKIYIPILKMIYGQFGNSCEVILYNTENFAHSVVAVAGNVSEQDLNHPLPEYILEMLDQKGTQVQDKFGFINKSLGHLALRSSVLFIRNPYGEIIGCIALNYNIIHFKMVISFLEEFSRSFDPNEEEEDLKLLSSDNKGESYTATNVEQFLENILADFLRDKMEHLSFDALDRMERIDVIRQLDEKGVFMVKGAVNTVARHLRMSKFTVYSYLDEIRGETPK